MEALGPEKGSRNAFSGLWGRLFRLHAIDPNCVHIRVDRMQAPCVFSEQAEGASPQSPPSPPSQSAWHVKLCEPSETGLSHAEVTVMIRTRRLGAIVRPKQAGIRWGFGFSEHQGKTWPMLSSCWLKLGFRTFLKANPHLHLAPGRLGTRRGGWGPAKVPRFQLDIYM